MQLSEKLEHPEKRFRLTVSTIGAPLDLKASTCRRAFWPDGTFFEMVMLEGSRSDLPEEQLEEFIRQHPISTSRERSADRQFGGRKP
jgi:hypothetical protein